MTIAELSPLVAADRVWARAALPDNAWDGGDDDEDIPPRGWLLGNQFCRGFLSGLTSPGGVGKSALRLLQAVSLASNKPLSGDHVFQRSRVLLVSFEDGRDELRRRLRAARLHHNISRDELVGWLTLWTPTGIKLAELKEGRQVQAGELEHQLRQVITSRRIDLVMFDPFVKLHGGIDENDNAMVDAICTMLTKLALEFDIAVDVTHHHNKMQADPGNPNSARGASALPNAGRLFFTLSPMSADEAAQFNISDAERRSLVRLDTAKLNIAPPATDARWYRLVGVSIGNSTSVYPHGDQVQTLELWSPPNFWSRFGTAVANEILDAIETGLPTGRRYSAASQASDDRAAWRLVKKHRPEFSDKQAKKVIATWLANDVIETRESHDPERRRPETGLYVNPAKRPE
jgi:hypothetical protein